MNEIFDTEGYVEQMRLYLENRPRFPLGELAKYRGKWIAWSPDGKRILASSNRPEDLEGLLQSAGQDPLCCVVEAIPDEDGSVGDFHARAE
jgi:hypothetical protein